MDIDNQQKEWIMQRIGNPTDIRNLALKSFQGLNSVIYKIQNDRNYDSGELVSRMHRYVTRVLKGIRKGDTSNADYWLAMAFSWSMALANRLHVDIEAEIWKRFPGVCPYCTDNVCSCKERALNRKDITEIRKANRDSKPVSLSGFQRMFSQIYGPKNNLHDSATHLAEEVGELDEVVAISTAISDILGLNKDLTQAIAWGHDIGHVPLGHPGEAFLAKRSGRAFTHEVMGVTIAQKIERNGRGLNSTHQVLDGMLRHSGSSSTVNLTPEGSVVRISDKIAFLFSDYNDFQRMGYPIGTELKTLMDSFGKHQRKRVSRVISSLCKESACKGRVEFTECDVAMRFTHLRKLMYDIYPRITRQNPEHILEPIYDFVEKADIADPLLIIGLMTDRDVEYLSDQPMLNMHHIRQTGAGEFMDCPEVMSLRIEPKPDLDW